MKNEELEQQIIKAARESSLKGYNSPLSKLVQKVVDENSEKLYSIMQSAFSEAISTETFRRSIVDAFSHKIARNMISQNDSMFDKLFAQMKTDQTLRAKIVLAVEKVVTDVMTLQNKTEKQRC